MRLGVRALMGMSAAMGLVAGGTAAGLDWPNYRGPSHDGSCAEQGFKTSWTQPPAVLWEAPVGSAFSTFACVKGRAYTCGTQDKHQVLFCFDANNGKEMWRKPFEPELKEGQGGDGTRATPTVSDGRVYLLGALGRLLCVDAETGQKEIWSKQFSAKPNWAYAGSVLIEGNLAIVTAGRKDGAILALDAKSGEVVWKCGDDPPGYSTPFPFTLEGKRYIFCFAARAGLIADAKTGKEVCRIPWETAHDVNASSPLYKDGCLFLSTGYETGCALFKLTPKGDKLEATEVWRNKAFLTKFTSCVLKDGILYGGDQRGLSCVDLKTGAELWKNSELKNASVLLVGEYLIIMSEQGQILIAQANPKEFKPTAKDEVLSGRCWTVPTLYEGKLYVRNLRKAACVDLRASAAGK